MKMQILECPKCHATLENDDENLGTFFCKYCGQKIVVEELQEVAYKTKVREMELEHEEKKMEFEQNKQSISYAQEKEKRAIEEKNRTKTILICCGLIGAILVMSTFMMYSGSFKHNRRVKQLRQVEAEVQSAIQKGDYDYAMIKVNEMRLDDNYSTSQTESWDAKREDYIRLIEDKQKGK